MMISINTKIYENLKTAALISGAIVVGGAIVTVSPIVGAIGLICTAARTTHDFARYKFAQYTDQHNKTPDPLSKKKVSYYKTRLNENSIHAEVFGKLLIPIIGFPLALKDKKIITSAIGSGIDIIGISSYLQKKAVQLFFPYSGKKLADLRNPDIFAIQRKELLEGCQGINVSIETRDHRKIDAVWLPNNRVPVNEVPTVILFHGNACVLDDMEDHMMFFKALGLNVLMVTFGGYPGSAEEHQLTELSLYHDVEAIGNYLKKLHIDNKQMVAYGWSMGGALAIQYGAFHKGSHVIADQTFTSLSGVAQNIVNKVVHVPLANPSIERLVKDILFPAGIQNGNITTDGFDSLAKIPKLQGEFLVIQSANDHMMSTQDSYGNHGAILAEKYATTANKIQRLVTIPGGHGAYFMNSPKATSQIKALFEEIQNS